MSPGIPDNPVPLILIHGLANQWASTPPHNSTGSSSGGNLKPHSGWTECVCDAAPGDKEVRGPQLIFICEGAFDFYSAIGRTRQN